VVYPDGEEDQTMPTVSLPSPPRGFRRTRPSSTAIAAALVRRSVGALSAGRHRCRHCHRTPLVGEYAYLYDAGARGQEIVCELCRPLRTASPERVVLVRSPEQASAVRAVRRT
jgi:hypothetical protein